MTLHWHGGTAGSACIDQLRVCHIRGKLQHAEDFPNKQKGLLLAYQTKAQVSFYEAVQEKPTC